MAAQLPSMENSPLYSFQGQDLPFFLLESPPKLFEETTPQKRIEKTYKNSISVRSPNISTMPLLALPPPSLRFPVRMGSLFPTPEQRANSIFLEIYQHHPAEEKRLSSSLSFSGPKSHAPWGKSLIAAEAQVKVLSLTEQVLAIIEEGENDLDNENAFSESDELIFQIDDLDLVE